MKIGILTFHNAHNYGATLQAFALRTVLRNNGYDAHIVNYCNRYLEKRYKEKLTPEVGKKELINPMRWKSILKKYSNSRFAQDEWSKQCQNFSLFIKEILLENNIEKIQKDELATLEYDVYICGSDQVWSSNITKGLDRVYFLDFPTRAKKISYAASISNKNIKEDEKDYFKKQLGKFDYISVREKPVADVLEKITSRKIVTTIDPTLLLKANDYNNLLAKNQETKKYIFAYFITENNELMDCAKYVSKLLGYKLVELHYYLQKDLIGHNQRADLGPKEFLTYMKNAEFILTNSFHGTVFSMLYHKKFYSVYDVDERKDNILRAVNLQSRHIRNKEEIDLDTVIEYEKIDELLEKYRKNSIEFLDKSLGEQA